MFVLVDQLESDASVPLDGGADVCDVDHGNDGRGHGSPAVILARTKMQRQVCGLKRWKFLRRICWETGFLLLALDVFSAGSWLCGLGELQDEKNITMEARFCGLCVCVAAATSPSAQQKTKSEEGGRVQALENAWNHALEVKDVKGAGYAAGEYVCVGGY